MGTIAQMKSEQGTIAPKSLTSATTLVIPGDANKYLMSGTTAVTSLLLADGVFAGRRLTFIGTDATGNVFTNTNSPTVAGTMDLGGSNITLAAQDVLLVEQQANGTWVRITSTDN